MDNNINKLFIKFNKCLKDKPIHECKTDFFNSCSKTKECSDYILLYMHINKSDLDKIKKSTQ